MFVRHHLNVPTLTSPPILKLWVTQGYLWLCFDLMEVINLIGETFEPKNIFFQKNTLCHSFRIIVIPSIVLSFLPDYCHSFRISVIPSELMLFLPNYCHFKYFSSWIAPKAFHTRREKGLLELAIFESENKNATSKIISPHWKSKEQWIREEFLAFMMIDCQASAWHQKSHIYFFSRKLICVVN